MTISETLSASPPPLQMEDDGTIRVGNTRVTLDTVIHAYQRGDRAEDIAESYPVLSLADVHAVIAHYLRHPREVETYLARREEEAAEVRRHVEEVCPPGDFWGMLRSRRERGEAEP